MTTTAAKERTRPRRMFNTVFVGYELRRNLRMYSNIFFIVVLPVFMFVIFGTVMSWADAPLTSANGNVSARVMISMAGYGAITATTGLAGSAAVELQQGWGRQLGLTPFSRGGYILSKVIVAVTIAALPVIAVYIVGFATKARMDLWVWPATAVVALLVSTVFALYGLTFGLLFRSESAVGAASGGIVVLMFLGNAFLPLSGFLLDFSQFTPVWGVMQLSLWPLTAGQVGTAGSITQYALWQPIVNVVAWASVFALGAYLASKRGTARR